MSEEQNDDMGMELDNRNKNLMSTLSQNDLTVGGRSGQYKWQGLKHLDHSDMDKDKNNTNWNAISADDLEVDGCRVQEGRHGRVCCS